MTPIVERVSTKGQDPSPPTLRVIRVIELLCREPGERLSLARIVREAGLSRATAHSVLSQLTSAGWTVRDEHGSFGLGPEFAALARRAESAFPLRRRALTEMHTLSADLGVPLFLAERGGEAVTITEVVGRPSITWIRPGRTLPIRPPVCREFVAWAPESEREAWLAAASTDAGNRLTHVLDAVRARGYAVERFTDESARMVDVIGSLRESPVTDAVRHRLRDVLNTLITIDYLPDELGPENLVVTVAAPVFDGESRVVASLVACPDNRLSAEQLTRLGNATAAAAARLSERECVVTL